LGGEGRGRVRIDKRDNEAPRKEKISNTIQNWVRGDSESTSDGVNCKKDYESSHLSRKGTRGRTWERGEYKRR